MKRMTVIAVSCFLGSTVGLAQLPEKHRGLASAEPQQIIQAPDGQTILAVPLSSLWWAIGLVGAPIVGGAIVAGRWFWKRHEDDIKGIDDRAQKAIKELKETVETNRKEMRSGIIDLHRKVEGIDSNAQTRHNELMIVLLEKK